MFESLMVMFEHTGWFTWRRMEGLTLKASIVLPSVVSCLIEFKENQEMLKQIWCVYSTMEPEIYIVIFVYQIEIFASIRSRSLSNTTSRIWSATRGGVTRLIALLNWNLWLGNLLGGNPPNAQLPFCQKLSPQHFFNILSPFSPFHLVSFEDLRILCTEEVIMYFTLNSPI